MDRREELELLLGRLEREKFQESLEYLRDTWGVTRRELQKYGAVVDIVGEIDLNDRNLYKAQEALRKVIGVKRVQAELEHLGVADLPWKWKDGTASLEFRCPKGEWITWSLNWDLRMSAEFPDHLSKDLNPINCGEKMAKMAREHYRPKAVREIAVKLNVDASAIKRELDKHREAVVGMVEEEVKARMHEAWKKFAKTPPGWDAEEIKQAVEELCKHDMPASLSSRFHYVRGLMGLPYWDPDSE